MDGQSAGLKELRLTRELSLMWGARLYFGNGELMESETVVVGVQGKGEICGRTRDEAPRKPRGSRPVQHRPNHPHLFLQLDYGPQPNVETTPVQARPPRYAPISSLFGRILTRELQESPLSESRGASHSLTPVRHTRTPQRLTFPQFGSQIRQRSV